MLEGLLIHLLKIRVILIVGYPIIVVVVHDRCLVTETPIHEGLLLQVMITSRLSGLQKVLWFFTDTQIGVIVDDLTQSQPR